MTENRRADGAKRAGRQKTRPTIGLLIGRLAERYQVHIWPGIADVMEERGINLIIFPGRTLETPVGFDRQRNVLYDLVGPENVEGLVIFSGTLANYIGPERVKNFCERYQPLPMVGIGVKIGEIPTVLTSNEKAMRDIVTHLIETHGYRRIAFICGPESNPEAQLRYSAYTQVLSEHDIPLDPDLIAQGDFTLPTGKKAIHLLLDERKAKFDAVVSANDDMALGALEALQERGIRVPNDIALTGFDDIEESRTLTPPLTTARQPLYEEGRRAAEMILTLLEGKSLPSEVILPAELVVRQSCGCLPEMVLQAAAENRPAATRSKLETFLAAQRDRIVAAMARALGDSIGGEDRQWAEALLDAFSASLQDRKPATFLYALDDLMRQTARQSGYLGGWHNMLSALRRYTLPALINRPDELWQAENLWHQARVLVSETAQRVQAYRRLREARDAFRVIDVGERLMTTFDLERLAEAMCETMPSLGIKSAYIALYDGPGVPSEYSRLVAAYDERGKIELEPGGRRFPSRRLVPEELLPSDRRLNLTVESLHFRDQRQLGFAVFEVEQAQAVPEVLSEQLSTALTGLLLLQERERAEAFIERRASQLQAALEVVRDASTAPDIRQFLDTAANGLAERLNFYHVGFFLVDEPGEYAILRAASSEDGRRMLERGYRVKITPQSAIGQVLATGKAHAVNISENAASPTGLGFPGVCSEALLPLQVRGRVMGFLDIHSTDPMAFAGEDITILQTMADQMATVIENIRLLERTETQLRELSRLYGEQTAAAWMALPQERATAYVYDRVDVLPAPESPSPALDAALARGERVIQTNPSESVLAAPLKVRGQIIGALGIQRGEGGREWTPEEIALIEAVSDQVAVALDSARLFSEARIRAEELAVLNDLARALTGIRDVKEVLEKSYACVSRLLHTTNFYVGLYDPERSMIDFVFNVSDAPEDQQITSIRADQGLSGYIVQTRKSLLIKENLNERLKELGIESIGAPALSWLGVPLLIGEQVLGMMAVQSYTTPRAYDEHDQDLLMAIASQAAIAIQSARLFEQAQRRAEQERRTYEITDKLRRSPDISTILQTAVEELGRALRTDRAIVRLMVKPGEEKSQTPSS